MESVDYTEKFRKSLGRVLTLLSKDSSPTQVLMAWGEVAHQYLAPEFSRYRESVGSLSSMMPEDTPKMNNGRATPQANYEDFQRSYQVCTGIVLSRELEGLMMEVIKLKTHAEIMGIHRESIDKAFSSRSE